MIDRDFTNPLTGTHYRLRGTPESWRISKVVTDGDDLSLRHLRGSSGTADVPEEALDCLVRGHHQERSVIADPDRTFARVVMMDLDRTYDVLMVVIRQAEEIYQQGRPGFRPRSSTLRMQRDQAITHATTNCLRMAKAWRDSGLLGDPPDWLVASLKDLSS